MIKRKETVIYQDKRSASNYKLDCGKSDAAEDVLDYLYYDTEDSTRLARKYDRYINFKLPFKQETA